MASRAKRIEISVDLTSEALIAEAAVVRRMSVSAFMLDAATREASRLLGRADIALMPADQDDAFARALDQADAAPGLAAAAAGERRYRRR